MFRVTRFFLSKSLTFQFVLMFIGFFVVIYSINGLELAAIDNNLLSAVAVLFGLYIGFLISNQRSRHSTFFELNREESAKIYITGKLRRKLSPSDSKKLISLLENYLIAQMDYALNEFHYADPIFDELFEFVTNIKTLNSQYLETKNSILSTLEEQQVSRYKLQSVLEDGVSRSEWFAVLSLYFVMVYSFLLLNMPDDLSKVLGALVCASITMVVSMLFKLSELQFNAQKKIWDPLSRLFASLGLVMYYPQPVIDHRLVKPDITKAHRIATYPNEYPNMEGKKVVLVPPSKIK